MSAPHRMDPDYKRKEEPSGHFKAAKSKALGSRLGKRFLAKDNSLKGVKVKGFDIQD